MSNLHKIEIINKLEKNRNFHIVSIDIESVMSTIFYFF